MIPNIVLRRDWHARPAKRVDELEADRIRYLVVHYSGADADEQADHRNCAGRVRGIQDFHMNVQGWNDIAYNWVVCRHGYVFRGRGFEIRSAATGAANGYTQAVCFLGNDSAGRLDVTPQAWEAIEDVYRFVARNAPGLEGARGHRDFMPTACPGDELYRLIRRLGS